MLMVPAARTPRAPSSWNSGSRLDPRAHPVGKSLERADDHRRREIAVAVVRDCALKKHAARSRSGHGFRKRWLMKERHERIKHVVHAHDGDKKITGRRVIALQIILRGRSGIVPRHPLVRRCNHSLNYR